MKKIILVGISFFVFGAALAPTPALAVPWNHQSCAIAGGSWGYIRGWGHEPDWGWGCMFRNASIARERDGLIFKYENGKVGERIAPVTASKIQEGMGGESDYGKVGERIAPVTAIRLPESKKPANSANAAGLSPALPSCGPGEKPPCGERNLPFPGQSK